MLGKARILKCGEYRSDGLPALKVEGEPRPRARVVKKQVLDASSQAQAILERAEKRARELVEAAERAAAEARLRAAAQGRADAAAELAARAIALRSRELGSAERSLDQLVDLARLLAERLLGEQLRLDPGLVAALARQALDEARGARHIVVEAHPDDVPLLEESLGSSGVRSGTVQVQSNQERRRGNLRIVTDVGVLDAELAPQLDRLAAQLRETLRS